MKYVLIFLAAVIGCGDNQPAPVEQPVAIPTVTLELPETSTPGARLDVKWTIDGDLPADANLELLLRKPGDAVGVTTAGYAYAGSAPARVFGGYIAPDGSFSMTELAVSDTSGQVSIELPAVEGDYQVVALVKAQDNILASDVATTWAATSGIRMQVSQLWVSPQDPVTIDATIVGDEDLRLSAWLVTPDGTTLTLPGRVDNYLPVAEGKIAGTYRLLASKLGAYGNGTYLLSSRLETLTGEERGFSGYELHVCDTLGSYSGTGATPGGTIVAQDLVFSRGTSTIADDAGNFTLAIPPGNYVIDGAGITTIAEVPCAPASKLRAAPASFEPKVRVILYSDNTSTKVSQGAATLINDNIQGAAMKAAPQLNVLTNQDIGKLTAHNAVLQALGSSSEPISVNLQALVSADYILFAKYADFVDKIGVQLRLIDVRTGTVVRSSQQVLTDTAEQVLDKLPALVADLRLNGSDLVENAEKLFTPIVEAHWDASVAAPGSTVTGYVGVVDSTSHSPGANVDVDLEFVIPGAAPTLVKGTTKFDGTYTFQYLVPSTLPLNVHSVTLTARISRKSGAKVASEGAPLVIQPSNALSKIDKPVLETGGDTTDVTVTRPALKDLSGARYSDLLAVPEGFGKFDATGTMKFTVASQNQTGPATVIVETFQTTTLQGPNVPHAVPTKTYTYAYVVNPLTINAFADPRTDTVNNGYLEIRGTVRLRGNPIPNYPISLDVVGDGTVEHATRTDADGVFRGLYRAPATGQGTTKIRIAVVKDARLAEAFVDVAYSPPCMNCPLTLFPGPVTRIERSGTRLISANQPVTWAAQGGTITNEGRFYAPGTGGTSIITATSVANPSQKATVVMEEDCVKAQVFRTFEGMVTIDGPVTAPHLPTCTGVSIKFQQEGPNKYGIAVHEQTCGTTPSLTGVSNVGFDGTIIQGCDLGFQTIDGQGCSAALIMHPDYNTIGTAKWSYEFAMGVPPAGSTTPCQSGRYSAHGIIDAQ